MKTALSQKIAMAFHTNFITADRIEQHRLRRIVLPTPKVVTIAQFSLSDTLRIHNNILFIPAAMSVQCSGSLIKKLLR
jgi:hypothetical protein